LRRFLRIAQNGIAARAKQGESFLALTLVSSVIPAITVIRYIWPREAEVPAGDRWVGLVNLITRAG
jgi:hypothetical protein